MLDMPLRIIVTPGISCTHRSAQDASEASGRSACSFPLRGSGQIRQLSAAHRLHDPDGNAIPVQQFAFLLCLLQRPVEIVQFDLTELHLVRVLFRNASSAGTPAWVEKPGGGYARFFSAPADTGGCSSARLRRRRWNFHRRCAADRNRNTHAALFQLLFEHGSLHVIAGRDLVSGNLSAR